MQIFKERRACFVINWDQDLEILCHLFCSSSKITQCHIILRVKKLMEDYSNPLCETEEEETHLEEIGSCAAEAIFCCPTENSHHLKS
jgi:hypothetical protein